MQSAVNHVPKLIINNLCQCLPIGVEHRTGPEIFVSGEGQTQGLAAEHGRGTQQDKVLPQRGRRHKSPSCHLPGRDHPVTWGFHSAPAHARSSRPNELFESRLVCAVIVSGNRRAVFVSKKFEFCDVENTNVPPCGMELLLLWLEKKEQHATTTWVFFLKICVAESKGFFLFFFWNGENKKEENLEIFI